MAGVDLTHPDRVLYPDLGLTKRDLATYVERVARWMLPHVKGRPLTLVRCGGPVSKANCVYLRHAKAWGASVLRRVRIREKTKVGEYLVAERADALVGLVQMGVVEIHTWNSTADDLERPNRLVWDLDPGPEIGWTDVVRGARTVRERLARLGVKSWVKTTGGKGLHVVAPLAPERTWTECLAFAKAVAEAMAAEEPDRYTTKFAKRGREAKILIDYLRNTRTNTSVAAYSPRARPGAPVSTPVAWRELSPRLSPARFTIVSVPRRLATVRDPWSGYWRCRQRLSSAAMADAGLAKPRVRMPFRRSGTARATRQKPA